MGKESHGFFVPEIDFDLICSESSVLPTTIVVPKVRVFYDYLSVKDG